MNDLKLTDEVLGETLRTLPQWKGTPHSITRTIETKDFKSAFEIGGKITKIAENMNHHPDLLISYGKIVVTLFTHDIGGVGEKDILLAREIETLL